MNYELYECPSYEVKFMNITILTLLGFFFWFTDLASQVTTPHRWDKQGIYMQIICTYSFRESIYHTKNEVSSAI